MEKELLQQASHVVYDHLVDPLFILGALVLNFCVDLFDGCLTLAGELVDLLADDRENVSVVLIFAFRSIDC